MKNEKTTSVRLPEETKKFMIERFGSIRGACIALVNLQKMVDETFSRDLKSIKNHSKDVKKT